MMAVTLEITPEFESLLRREASKEGLDTQGYIVGTLRKHLAAMRHVTTPRLDARETELLQKSHEGLPAET